MNLGGLADLLTATGGLQMPQVKLFSGARLPLTTDLLPDAALLDDFFAYAGATRGAFVGGH
ncbi:MAG: hypothetical protein HYS12_11875 [Planctomycetes bacterium]|nr:hypothetical protein [Planctomycetota bacterium]